MTPFRKAREADREVRMNGTTELPVETADARRTESADGNIFVSDQANMVKKSRLNSGEQATLRNLIQGPVAAMAAEQLSGLLDAGLETDIRYKSVIAEMYERILAPDARIQDHLAFLDEEVRSRFKSNGNPAALPPTAMKVMLLEAVARELGKNWSCDAASFIDVTIASARLQAIAQALTTEAARDRSGSKAPFAVIFLPVDEQHSLMSYLTGALFQALGWQQQVVPHESLSEFEFAKVVTQADVVCIAWSTAYLKSNAIQLINDIKLYSSQKTLPIIAGGAATLDFIDPLVEMGVDCICDSALSAVKIAESFYNLEKINHFAAQEGRDAKRRKSSIDRHSQ